MTPSNRVLFIAGLLSILTSCSTPDQVYFTKPGEWDPAVLARDQEECEAFATNSVPYRRAYSNPFMSFFARGILVDETRDCLIQLRGWKTTETLTPHP